MKTKSVICVSLAAVMAIAISSCSKSNDNEDPAGTISLNMLDEDNGKTLLGNSDVYIDNAFNFYGPSCSIASLGKKNGLGSILVPVIAGLGNKVAVETGAAYQIFRQAAVKEFPSGTIAIRTDADYYNVYVVASTEKDDKKIGANIKYVLMDVPEYGLPGYSEEIGTLDHNDYLDGRELTLTLPSSDFEYVPVFAGSNYYTLEHEKAGDKLFVKLVDFKYSDIFGFYIRIKGSYTYVYGTVI